jgi:hypothetical protein
VREKAIENYLVNQVRKHGGRAYKWVSPGNIGVPDRIVMFSCWQKPMFVELKAPGGRLSAQQRVQHKKLRNLNAWVFVVSSKKEVDEFIQRFREI